MYRSQSRGLSGTVTATQAGNAGAAVALTALSVAFPPFAPVFAIVGALLGPIEGLFQTSVAGKEKIAATHCNNSFASDTAANLQNYLAGARTVEDQQAAEAYFTSAWDQMVQCCGQVPGAPGQKCVTDRQRGGKFDAWAAAYDPIANSTPSDEYTPTGVAEELGVSSNAASIVGWGALAVLGLMIL